LYIINFSTLRFRVQNETTFISAKNHVDLISISEVRSYITEWPRFLAHPVYRTIFSAGFIGPKSNPIPIDTLPAITGQLGL